MEAKELREQARNIYTKPTGTNERALDMVFTMVMAQIEVLERVEELLERMDSRDVPN